MSRGGAREGAGAPSKKIKRDKKVWVATTETKKNRIDNKIDDIVKLLSSRDKAFADDILLKALDNFYKLELEKHFALIEENFNKKEYTITNVEFSKTRMSKKVKELIQIEKSKLDEKNIDYKDVYSFHNEFIVIKINSLTSIFKSVGNFKSLEEYEEHLEELDYINFKKENGIND